jgi:anti-anti-sigma factor
MQIEKRIEPNYAVITLLDQKLDSKISPDLKSEFVLLNSEGRKNIVLNMEHVKYADSSGLSAILVAHRLCKNENGILALCKLSDHVVKLINISMLDSVLNILPTEEEAVQEVIMHYMEASIEESGESQVGTSPN